ncbi:DUF1043 family protein [Halomonas piscis]|uniref:DUF1043 family protein n=1 Tax=Halomonas piscis TaxID=3031727 RepID=A0ABY9Z2P2_9GAMM|nr:DUF1043 family protein [Halomonas piscis]WNK21407.1 DUF1043 family protein [Halomonas piscis]
MEEPGLQLTFALIGIFIGMAIGAFGHRLLSRSQRQVSSMKLELLESERRIAALKADMQSHLGDTHRRIDGVRHALAELDQGLHRQAKTWGVADDVLISHDNDPLRTAARAPLAQTAGSSEGERPKDYAADGEGGTLSEDFGLKNKASDAGQAPEPPRY